jgi:hypothetical protein
MRIFMVQAGQGLGLAQPGVARSLPFAFRRLPSLWALTITIWHCDTHARNRRREADGRNLQLGHQEDNPINIRAGLTPGINSAL